MFGKSYQLGFTVYKALGLLIWTENGRGVAEVTTLGNDHIADIRVTERPNGFAQVMIEGEGWHISLSNRPIFQTAVKAQAICLRYALIVWGN